MLLLQALNTLIKSPKAFIERFKQARINYDTGLYGSESKYMRGLHDRYEREDAQLAETFL